MADKKDPIDKDHNQIVVDRAKDFWTRNSKPLMIVSVIVILVAGGYIGYKKFYKEPQEKKAAQALYRAESNFKRALGAPNPDSLVKIALNGNPGNLGFLQVIKKYGGTDAGNLAKLYAGESYLMLNDNVNAVKYLKDFSTGSKFFQARAYKLLGDAYADQGKDSDAFDYYKKGAHHFEEDADNASESLFLAAYLAHSKLNKTKDAIELYKELKDKFPNTQRGYEADKQLGRLGVYDY